MNYEGAVKAMKGGNNWNISKYNRATQSKRQVGSIFKTFTIALALEEEIVESKTIINNIKTYLGALDVIEKILLGSKNLNIILLYLNSIY